MRTRRISYRPSYRASGFGLISTLGFWTQSKFFSCAARIVVSLLGVGMEAHAAVHYQRVKSFGFSALTGISPYASLVQGSDGALYGSTAGGGNYGGGTLFRINSDGTDFRFLHHFRASSGDGRVPYAGLIQGNDGALYGTTGAGGGNDAGTVFVLNLDGSGYRILHSMSTNGVDAAYPDKPLVQGTDGILYGTTSGGGSAGGGAVFKLNKDGSDYRVLHSFNRTALDLPTVPSALVEGDEGALYGMTRNGGSFDAGAVFKLNKDGSDYRDVYIFSPNAGSSQRPVGLVAGSGGALYGVTGNGGSNSAGTVFKINTDGSDFSVLHEFSSNGVDGQIPTGLSGGADGMLYGATYSGGSSNLGTVFKLNKDGSAYALLRSFSGSLGSDGQNPEAPPIQGRDGMLYGTTASGGAMTGDSVFKLNTSGTDYRILRSFSAPPLDGQTPAGLVEGGDRALYGTTTYGGSNGAGTVFTVNRDGTGYRLLHSFSTSGLDGTYPLAPLLKGSDGRLYGTTQGGGLVPSYGTIFRLNNDGSGYSIMHNFARNGLTWSNHLDGYWPTAGLVEGTGGALFGTAPYGGDVDDRGLIFRLDRNSDFFSSTHSFGAFFDDGWHPSAPLLVASDGALYGTTWGGGSNIYYGTLFKLNQDGTGYTVLHDFGSGPNDGSTPLAGLVEGSDGALYGTTAYGGSAGAGDVFKVNKDGSGYRRLHNFTGPSGPNPNVWVVVGNDGALYGATVYGGGANAGMLFKLNKDGSAFSVLHSFGSSERDGQNPSGGLIKGSDGAFYGTTAAGGDLGQGTVYRLLPPQTPDMIAVTVTNNTAHVSFAGVSGYRYQVLRSTDLTNWSILNTITMPATGIYTNTDNAASNATAFYRAAWVP